jgi:ABC-type antimicrobial peptide transport system ATPase subunit
MISKKVVFLPLTIIKNTVTSKAVFQMIKQVPMFKAVFQTTVLLRLKVSTAKFHPYTSHKVKQVPKTKNPIPNDEKLATLFGTTSNSHQMESMFTAISAGVVMARKPVSAPSSGISKNTTKENTNNTNQNYLLDKLNIMAFVMREKSSD